MLGPVDEPTDESVIVELLQVRLPSGVISAVGIMALLTTVTSELVSQLVLLSITYSV